MEKQKTHRSPNKRSTHNQARTSTLIHKKTNSVLSKSIEKYAEKNEANLSVDWNPKFKDLELSDQINSIIIQEAFRMFDSDGSQEIDKKEFRKLVQSLGIEAKASKIDQMMKEVDKDGSGQINLKEFTEMMEKYQSQIPIFTHLQSTFNLYDKDGDGIISEEDLMKTSLELEDIMSADDAILMINLAHSLTPSRNQDIEKDKFGMDLNEFIYFLLNTNFLKEIKTNDLRQKEKKSETASLIKPEMTSSEVNKSIRGSMKGSSKGEASKN